MKHIKQMTALLLTLSMVTMLSACGGSNGSTGSTASAESAVSESAEESVAIQKTEETPREPNSVAEVSVEEETAAEVSTFTGAVAAADSQIVYPIEEEGVTLTYWHPFTSTMPGIYDDITDIPAVQAISENTGVTIEWTTVSGMEMFSSFNLMAAAGDYCDLMEAAVECYSGGAVGALDDGVIMDLTEYVEANCPDYLEAFRSRDAAKDIVTDDGRYACIYGGYNYESNAQGYVIRNDWLEELNLDTPVTYEDYFNVLSAFKNAYGCTEAFMMDETCQDEYHTSGGFGIPGYKNSAFGAGSDLYQENGVVKSSFLEDGYRDYLTEMNKWYTAGLFTADFVTLPSRPNADERTQLINSGNSGIWYVGATAIDGQCKDAGGADIRGIADPVVNVGDKNHFSSATIVNTQCDVAVSADCENIEAALQYLNYFFTDDGIMLYNYGIAGESYNVEDGKVVYTDLIMNPVSGYTPFTMTEAYVLVGAIASVTDQDRSLAFYSDVANEALDIWNASQDTEMSLPTNLALTTEENTEVSAKLSDITTYVSECIPKFILGSMSVETEWDTFTETCRSMGLENVIAIYQTALDRYNG